MSTPLLEWASPLKGRKLSECPDAHLSNYGSSSDNSKILNATIDFIILIKRFDKQLF